MAKRKVSDFRIVGEIQCPDFYGGRIYPKSAAEFRELKEGMAETVIKHGCTITFSAEPKTARKEQGSLFPTAPPKGGQRSLFGRR